MERKYFPLTSDHWGWTFQPLRAVPKSALAGVVLEGRTDWTPSYLFAVKDFEMGLWAP